MEILIIVKYICFFLLRVSEGIKNGIIYYHQVFLKGAYREKEPHKYLLWFEANIHRVEYLSLYSLIGLVVSFSAFQWQLESFSKQIALFIMVYYIAEPFRQWFINEGTGLKEEGYKTVTLFGKKIDLLRLNIKQKSIVAVVAFVFFIIIEVWL